MEKASKQNGVGEDCTGLNHMGSDNIQNLDDPHSNHQYPVTGLSAMERDEHGLPRKENGSTGASNGDENFQIPKHSSSPFSDPQHPLSGLLIMKRDEGAEAEVCKKNGALHSGGGQEGDGNGWIGRGKDNGNSPPKPTTFNQYRLVDDFIFCDRSLVGRFTRLRPSVQELSQWSNTHWFSNLRSIWMFKTLGEGFFKIEFYDQDDCEFVLENGPWFMGVAGLSLKRWTSEFDPQNPGPLKTPVRMTLPDLPPELWKEELLIKICSKVGRVLQIAHDTTEMKDGSATARVCVEMDLSKGLLPMLDLQFAGISLKQELDYEGIPFRCKVCRSAEHLEGSCPSKSTKMGRKKGAVIVCNELRTGGKAHRITRT